jgi:hypothetical protein
MEGMRRTVGWRRLLLSPSSSSFVVVVVIVVIVADASVNTEDGEMVI